MYYLLRKSAFRELTKIKSHFKCRINNPLKMKNLRTVFFTHILTVNTELSFMWFSLLLFRKDKKLSFSFKTHLMVSISATVALYSMSCYNLCLQLPTTFTFYIFCLINCRCMTLTGFYILPLCSYEIYGFLFLYNCKIRDFRSCSHFNKLFTAKSF